MEKADIQKQITQYTEKRDKLGSSLNELLNQKEKERESSILSGSVSEKLSVINSGIQSTQDAISEINSRISALQAELSAIEQEESKEERLNELAAMTHQASEYMKEFNDTWSRLRKGFSRDIVRMASLMLDLENESAEFLSSLQHTYPDVHRAFSPRSSQERFSSQSGWIQAVSPFREVIESRGGDIGSVLSPMVSELTSATFTNQFEDHKVSDPMNDIERLVWDAFVNQIKAERRHREIHKRAA